MTTTPRFTIKPAITPEALTAIKSLFTAYATSLNIDLSFQNFTAELDSLPGSYAAPFGALYLAITPDQEAIGCVGLRPLPEKSSKKICEMKRLYCTPSSRGLGVGRALVKQVIFEAERLEYEEMRLDTLPNMDGARKLYDQYGFREIEAYYDTPLEGTLFLGKNLGNVRR